jgi:hypothetical protein
MEHFGTEPLFRPPSTTLLKRPRQQTAPVLFLHLLATNSNACPRLPCVACSHKSTISMGPNMREHDIGNEFPRRCAVNTAPVPALRALRGKQRLKTTPVLVLLPY